MISVPTSTSSQSPAPQTSGPQPDDVFLMIAAGQMHSEGRLIVPGADSSTPTPSQAAKSK